MADSNEFQKLKLSDLSKKGLSLNFDPTLTLPKTTWRDKLTWDDTTYHLASFRGAKFYVENTNTEVGRRNVVHQYPFRDTPYVEDLGKDADQFTVNGYIIQNKQNNYNHFPDRNKLIGALKTYGSGTLIHPFYGGMKVSVVGKSSVSESLSRDGGIAKFTMTFVQAGVNTFPTQTIDPVGKMDKVAEDAYNAIADSASSQYDYSSRSESTMTNDLTSFTGMTKAVLSKIKDPVSGTVSKTINEIDDFTIADYIDTGTNLLNMVTGVLNSPLLLIGIPNAINKGTLGGWSEVFIGTLLEFPSDSIPYKLGSSLTKAFISIKKFGTAIGNATASPYGGTISVKSVSSPTSARETMNQQVLINTVKSMAIVNEVKVAVRSEYPSYDDSVEITDTVVDTIDDLLFDLGDEAARTDFADYDLTYEVDDIYDALVSVKDTFIQSMKQIGADLAKKVDYTVPPVVTPAIVLAYRKYNDISRENEIVDRNSALVDHPGFLPEGQVLEILSE